MASRIAISSSDASNFGVAASLVAAAGAPLAGGELFTAVGVTGDAM